MIYVSENGGPQTMTFRNKLEQDLIAAAKAADKVRLSALRLVKNGLHNREIDLKRELDEAEFIQYLSGMVKQRRESIEQFEKGGRPDLVAKEEAELRVIQEFMPAQMSEAEIEAVIAETIRETGAAGIRDMGKLMKALMPRVAGKADGKAVGEKVKQLLSA
jgi:uncharacterized protein YqeY